MPVVTVQIEKTGVHHVKVRGVWREKYRVYPVGWSNWCETFDALIASACERAAVTGSPVTLGLRDTTWGPEIVTAELTPRTAA